MHLKQRGKELWMLGIVTALLSVGFIVFFFYQKEKKKRLQRENLLLHKEAELSGLREQEIRLQNKEAELRETLFRRIAFFGSYLRSIMMKVRMKWLPVVKL